MLWEFEHSVMDNQRLGIYKIAESSIKELWNIKYDREASAYSPPPHHQAWMCLIMLLPESISTGFHYNIKKPITLKESSKNYKAYPYVTCVAQALFP